MKRMIHLWVILFLGMTGHSYAQKLPKSLERGLVAYYKMDANGQDASGNQNDGYLNGGITPVKDRFGNDCSALHFNGHNSFIQVPDSKSISNVQDALTVSTWFKLGQGNEYAGLKWLTVVCKSNLGKECDESPHFRMQATEWTVSLNTEFTEETRQTWNYDQWYLYTMTYDGRYVRTYLDEQLIFEFPYTGALEPNSMPMEIGRDIPGNIEYFVGVMDDLRIYNRALADNEIRELYRDTTDKNKKFNPCANDPAPPVRKPQPEPEETPPPPRRTNPNPPVIVTPTPDPTPQDEPVVVTPPVNPQPQPLPAPNPPAYEGTYTPGTGISNSGDWVPTTLGGDVVEYQDIIEVKSPEIMIYPFDHEREDGDTVSININGVWIVEGYEIKNFNALTTRGFRLSLQPGQENYLVSKAWNLGLVPPNTLTIEIRDGAGNAFRIPIVSEIGKSGAIKIVYEPE
ncbi:MAG: LamG domain-containing protein [Phaeodactylibacter sp.]|nr:LamG domain-containing protein [Phaeodactylibacter sp.]